MNPHDREQILGMMDLIDMYVAGTLSLRRLVDALDGKLNGMLFADERFHKAYMRHWGDLEFRNAIIIYDIEMGKAQSYAERAADFSERILKDVQNMRRFLEAELGPEGWTPRPET